MSLDRRLNDSKRTADEVERVYESDDLATAIDILLRNRILEGSTTPDGIAMSKVVSDSNVVDLPPSIRAIRPVREWLPEIVATSYHLTALGIAFVKACQAPPSVESH